MSEDLRVLLDATAIPGDLGGVGRYLVELVPELVALGVDLTVVTRPDLVDRFGAAAVLAAPAGTGSAPRRLAWEQTGLPALARRTGAQVLHSPHYTMPVIRTGRRVVTLHDATFFTDPAVHSAVKGKFFRAATRYAVRHADALVVPSQATADEVARCAGPATGAVVVAHHGVDTGRFHAVEPAEQRRVADNLGVEPGRYVAFLGTLEPRKNVPALVRAWVEENVSRPDPWPLVLAGGAGWDDAVAPALAAVPAGLRVVRAGYLPLDDLPGYLAGAGVVAYPSLGEGFGLPVLEAMACGAAVLTTRELSLPEVGGDAVAYCGTDETSIAGALRALHDDAARRAELSRAASARAATFTWRAAAERHVEAYVAAARRRAR